MTRPRRDGNEPPFNQWFRDNPRLDSIKESLSVLDSDLWDHKFRIHSDRRGSRDVQHLSLIEVKTFEAELTEAQRDTLWVITTALMRKKEGCNRPFIFQMPHYFRNGSNRRCNLRTVWCWGAHVLRMSHDSPQSSGWMMWDKKEIDVEMLEELLRFERDHFTLRPRSDRRHHADNGPPPLF